MTTVPYTGKQRKLVLAFDVGTTYSGISYCLLEPEQVPEIKGITKFPGLENVSGSSKIPTVVYYDQEGRVKSVGAEALAEGMFDRATEEKWVKAEWFKLHLRPNASWTQDLTSRLPPLPPNKQAVEVLSDFLRYLFRCTRTYIQESHAKGLELWLGVVSDIHYVFPHPNGWEGVQQAHLRKAFVLADLIPDTAEGSSRLSFVTEGEASLHYAIKRDLPKQATLTSDGVAIVNAGGGTINISAYSRSSTEKETYEEIAPSQCFFQGSAFVTLYAREFLERRLEESIFKNDIDLITRCFDKTTKTRFKTDKEPQFIKFGSNRDKDPSAEIRFGQMKLAGDDVSDFFKKSVDCIVEGVKTIRRNSHKKFTNVVLVGGFAANDWLLEKTTKGLKSAGYTTTRPEGFINKTVSDGALIYYLDRNVDTRVSKLTYGSRGSINYNPTKAEHQRHLAKAFTSISGVPRIPNVFWVLLPANTQVPETNEVRRKHYWEFTDPDGLKRAVSRVFYYRGEVKDGSFMDDEPDKYSELCAIEVDLSHLAGTSAVETVASSSGPTFYRIGYTLVLFFGGTEIKAQLAWLENGIEKRSPARIVYTNTLPDQ